MDLIEEPTTKSAGRWGAPSFARAREPAGDSEQAGSTPGQPEPSPVPEAMHRIDDPLGSSQIPVGLGTSQAELGRARGPDGSDARPGCGAGGDERGPAPLCTPPGVFEGGPPKKISGAAPRLTLARRAGTRVKVGLGLGRTLDSSGVVSNLLEALSAILVSRTNGITTAEAALALGVGVGRGSATAIGLALRRLGWRPRRLGTTSQSVRERRYFPEDV